MRFILLALALALPSAVQAQDEVQTSGSAQAREGKNWGVGLGWGAFLAPIFGGSLQGFYALNADTQIDFQLWSGTWSAAGLIDANSGVALQKFDVNASQNQLRLKYFLGNSFYFAGGLGARTIEFDLEATDYTGTRLKGNLKSNAMMLNFAMGNTWTFDSGFYIGGEWLAFTVPMGSGFSTDFSITGTNSGDIRSLQADAEKTAKNLGEITTGGLAMLHLGFQF